MIQATPGSNPMSWSTPRDAVYASSILLALLPSCGSTGNAVNAAVNTAAALGAAAYERSQGGCHASCSPGTHCNEETGRW
ncbi:MAG: hypothetical protein HY907_12605 [Deltaproteobacteria bacterium]|nr:hypothetical protein [Deltaproteobacteria bacterium]